MRKRAFLIGVDGATFDLIKPWANAGQLPHFKRWLDVGAHTTLRSTIHPITPQAWTTIFTGVNAGRHGVFDFGLFDIGKPYQPFNSHAIGSKPIWQLLSERGLPVIVINAIGTYPPKPLNGLLVTGRMTPPGEPYTWPPRLADEIAGQVGEYIIDLDPNQAPHLKEATESEFLDHLLRMVRARTATTLHLARKYPWSLLMAVFMAVDIAQHYYWRYIDPNHPDYTTKAPKRVRNAILEVYQELDRSLEAFEELLDDATTAFIVSDHGFGPFYGQVNLRRWLIEQGYLTLREETPMNRWQKWGLKMRQTLSNMVPPSIRRPLRMRGLGTRGLPALYQIMGIDWAQTRAYPLGDFGSLFVNLEGREPLGTVRPGSECEALRNELIEKLQSWRNPHTDTPLMRKVYRREDLFNGPLAERAPDLLVEWENYAYVFYAPCNPSAPLIAPPGRHFYQRLYWSGMHHLHGVWMCKGAGIDPLESSQIAHLVDIAPTLLYCLDQPIPEKLEGRVWRELVKGQEITDSEKGQLTVEEQDAGFTPEEIAAIQERLRGLGYLE